MDMLWRVALHEAAHAVGFLAIGVRVDELEADRHDGGYCKPAEVYSWPAIPAVLAGAVAESLFSGAQFSEGLSGEDERITRQLEVEFEIDMRRAVADQDRQRWRYQAEAILTNHESNVRQLAAELRDRRKFTLAALAEYAHRPASALAPWKSLYPKPAVKKRAQLRPADPPMKAASMSAVPSCLPPGSYWSEEHKCYLCPAPKRQGAHRMRLVPVGETF